MVKMLMLKSIAKSHAYRSLWPFAAWFVPLLLALSVGVGMRLWELPDWNEPELMVAGEVLLSKHDAYGWLAGAKHINQHSSSPFSTGVRIVHETIGMPLDQIAFWLPVLLAPLAALPVCLLVFWWGIPEAGMVAGVMAGSSIGYFIRSRVTCLDTDVLTLFFPLCLAAGLIMWLESVTPQPRGRGYAPAPGVVLLLAFLLGLLYRGYIVFYPSGEPVGLSILGLALLTGMILSAARYRLLIASGLLIVGLVGDGLWPETAIAAGAVFLTFLRPDLLARRKAAIVLLVLLGGALWWLSDFTAKATAIWFHFSRYGRLTGGTGASTLPPVIETVPEAWPVSLDGAIFFMAGNWPLFVIGIAGLLIVLWKRPGALLLLPLLILSLASVRLGIRFTMYGGAVLGIGLACGTALCLRAVHAPRWAIIAAQLVLLFAVCWPLGKTVEAVDPEPVIAEPLVSALLELKQRSAADAQLWVRWDLGYAVQYYAERMTLVDGYRNSAEEVFPVTFVYAASTPLSAYQMIARCSLLQQSSGPATVADGQLPYYQNPFPDLMRKLTPTAFNSFLQDLKRPKVAWTHELPQQYLVLTWEDMQRAHTLLSYGSWDFVQGRPGPGEFFVIREHAEYDLDSGLMTVGNKVYQLSSKEMITGNGRQYLTWPQENGWHAVARIVDGVTFMMDDAAYQTMMVQMLLAEPERFEPYFELFIDRFPFVRIYRINPILTGLPPGVGFLLGAGHEGR